MARRTGPDPTAHPDPGPADAGDPTRPHGGGDTAPVPWWVVTSGLFVLAAIAAEVVASAFANSQAPGWALYVVPLAWPAAARVVWWLVVAAAAAVYHVGLARAGHPRRPVLAVLTVGLFVAFAVSIAFGGQWATWH